MFMLYVPGWDPRLQYIWDNSKLPRIKKWDSNSVLLFFMTLYLGYWCEYGQIKVMKRLYLGSKGSSINEYQFWCTLL